MNIQKSQICTKKIFKTLHHYLVWFHLITWSISSQAPHYDLHHFVLNLNRRHLLSCPLALLHLLLLSLLLLFGRSHPKLLQKLKKKLTIFGTMWLNLKNHFFLFFIINFPTFINKPYVKHYIFCHPGTWIQF